MADNDVRKLSRRADARNGGKASTGKKVTKSEVRSDAKTNKERQEARTKSLKKKFGQTMSFFMSKENKKRLDRIAKHLSINDCGVTETRCLTVAELINQYHVDNILLRKNKTAEVIYDTYQVIWEKQRQDKMDDKDIAKWLSNEGYPVPVKNKDGSVSLKNREWKVKEVLLYRDASKVRNMILKANKSSTG